jgi:hypothetical protein
MLGPLLVGEAAFETSGLLSSLPKSTARGGAACSLHQWSRLRKNLILALRSVVNSMPSCSVIHSQHP